MAFDYLEQRKKDKKNETPMSKQRYKDMLASYGAMVEGETYHKDMDTLTHTGPGKLKKEKGKYKNVRTGKTGPRKFKGGGVATRGLGKAFMKGGKV
tara:strand:+ start:211 stop:498 length:288 start_codon:yes stop_codon:yes gene_type:complete